MYSSHMASKYESLRGTLLSSSVMQGLWWLRGVANVGRFAAIDANILAPYPFRRPCNKVLDAVSSFVLTCMSHTHIVTANVASIDDQYLFRAYCI